MDKESLIKSYEKVFLSEMKKKKIPGAAIAIVFQNEVIYLNSFGVRALGLPETVNPQTVFQLGSISKTFAGTLSAVLVQKKIFSYQDPVIMHLPDFYLQNIKDKNELQIQHLLSHSSSIPRVGFNALIESFQPYQKIRSALQSATSVCEPGKCYDYHNAMFAMIKEVIESTTKKTYFDALNDEILRPLNMSDTTSTLAGLKLKDNFAFPHVQNKSGIFRRVEKHSQGYYEFVPTGGVNSTITDMAEFLKLQMGAYQNVISNASLENLHSAFIKAPDAFVYFASRFNNKPLTDSYYGLGFRILNFGKEQIVGHGGYLNGFRNFLAFMPKYGIGIVVLQNTDSSFATNMAFKFLEMFVKQEDKKSL